MMFSVVLHLLCLSWAIDAYLSSHPLLFGGTSCKNGQSLVINYLVKCPRSRNCNNAIVSPRSATHQLSIGTRSMALHMSEVTPIDRTITTIPPITNSLSPSTFAGQVEQALIKRFTPSKITRVLQSWRLLEMDYEHREFVGSLVPSRPQGHCLVG